MGQRAKHAAYNLAFGKDVTLQTHGKDKYGRTLGAVILPDGTHVNHTLVKNGWCWWYYAPENTELEKLENNACAGSKDCGHTIAAAVERKSVKQLLIHLSSAHLQDMEKKGLLPKGKCLALSVRKVNLMNGGGSCSKQLKVVPGFTSCSSDPNSFR